MIFPAHIINKLLPKSRFLEASIPWKGQGLAHKRYHSCCQHLLSDLHWTATAVAWLEEEDYLQRYLIQKLHAALCFPNNIFPMMTPIINTIKISGSTNQQGFFSGENLDLDLLHMPLEKTQNRSVSRTQWLQIQATSSYDKMCTTGDMGSSTDTTAEQILQKDDLSWGFFVGYAPWTPWVWNPQLSVEIVESGNKNLASSSLCVKSSHSVIPATNRTEEKRSDKPTKRFDCIHSFIPNPPPDQAPACPSHRKQIRTLKSQIPPPQIP